MGLTTFPSSRYYGATIPMESIQDISRSAVSLIHSARHLTAFTGASISVESGIPPFRGEGDL